MGFYNNLRTGVEGFAIGAPLVTPMAYAADDWIPQEGEGLNLGEAALNFGAYSIPLAGTVAGSATGIGLEALAKRMRRPGLKQEPPSLTTPAQQTAMTIGALAGGIPTAGWAIDYYNDEPSQPPVGITQNIPMQEVQELNDLLGANGAYQ